MLKLNQSEGDGGEDLNAAMNRELWVLLEGMLLLLLHIAIRDGRCSSYLL